ncbi:MAG: cobalamin biosynthesis protein CobQ [Pseudomonadota bacterium]
MNTPAHLLLGAAAFSGRHADRRLIWAGMIGGLLPDVSLYVLAGVSLLVLRIPPQVVFDELYFSDLWQSIFAIDNSFFVWGLLCALSLWRRIDWAVALTAAALLHLALDFPLHHDDGRPHFWPLSAWVFESPVSYWDRGHYAMYVAPVETLLSAACALWLWAQRPGWLLSLVIGILVLAQLRVATVWMFIFANG